MTTIAPLDLGSNGVAYVRAELQDTGLLPSLVMQALNGAETAFALLPQGTSPERALKFDTGGMMRMGASHQWFADYIAPRWGNACQLVFAEDPWLAPPDFKTHPPKSRQFQCDSKLYYAPDGRDIYAALNAGMREVASFILRGFVVAPAVALPLSGQPMDQNGARMLAHNTQAVFVSAYDQESYVVWQR